MTCTHKNLAAGQSIGWQDDGCGTLTELLNCPDCGSTLGGREVIRIGYQRPGPLTQYVRARLAERVQPAKAA